MMRKPDMRTVKTTTAVSVAVLAMLAVPANAAMASDFQQDERDYTAAVSRSITLTSELKTGADEAKAKTVNAKDDDAATRLARESLRSRIAKAADVHAVSKEKATVFNVSSLTDQAVSSGRTAKSLSSSIDDGVRKVDDAVAAHRLRDARKNLETAAENGRKTLESSNGKVDDDNNRGQLSDVLNKTKAIAASADADAIGRTAKTLNDLIAKVNADVQSRDRPRRPSVSRPSSRPPPIHPAPPDPPDTLTPPVPQLPAPPVRDTPPRPPARWIPRPTTAKAPSTAAAWST